MIIIMTILTTYSILGSSKMMPFCCLILFQAKSGVATAECVPTGNLVPK